MQNSGRGLACRFRNLPRSLRATLLAAPAVAAIGALGIPAMASAATPSASLSTRQAAGDPPHDWQVRLQTRITAAQLRTFCRAGYTYGDAVLLSRLWSNGTTAGDAKLRAGAKLLHREALPIRPHQNPWRVGDDVALDAYVNNGYTYQDARKLAKVWRGIGDLTGVKANAGRKLLAGLRVPSVSASAASTARLNAYFRAGFDYDDAGLLSRLWSDGTSPADAKLRAGSKLLHSEELPIEPGQDAWSVSKDAALDTYFNHGLGYDDARRLAKVWTGVSDISDVKANAGRKLLAGLPLPLQ